MGNIIIIIVINIVVMVCTIVVALFSNLRTPFPCETGMSVSTHFVFALIYADSECNKNKLSFRSNVDFKAAFYPGSGLYS